MQGYARSAQRQDHDALDCQKPLMVTCDRCDAPPILWRCSSHRASACRPCAARYRRRVLRIASSGLDRWGAQRGFLYLLTVTAPAEGKAHCMKAGCPHQGDGVGCRHRRCRCTPVGGVDIADWNAGHSRRWNRLRTRLRQLHPDLVYMRGVEAQDGKHRLDGKGRAALHDHAVCWSPTRLTVQELRRVAMNAGFGHSCDLAPLAPGSKKAAYYVAKYVGKSTDVRAQVPWFRHRRVVPAPGTAAAGAAHRPGGLRWDHAGPVEAAALAALGDDAVVLERLGTPMWSPDEGCWVQLADDTGDDWRAWTPVQASSAATYRTWSCSRNWGLTMAAVKAQAAAYAALRAPQGAPDAPEGVADPTLAPPAGRGAPPAG